MPKSLVAGRVAEIPFAGIRKVFEKAASMEANGQKVIHFEIGRPDFDTPSHIKKAAMEALESGMVHYTSNAGVTKLREAIAASIFDYKGIRYDPNSEVMVTAGGQEAMYLSLQSILEPGDEVLVPDPGYSQFYSCVRLLGGVVIPMPSLSNDNACPDLEAARALVTGKTRAIIINSPHNPTGGVLSGEQLERICNFAEEHDLILLSDEAYDHLIYDGVHFVSPASFPDMKKRTFIWGSLSKTYAMTGWRIGYLAAPAPVVAACIKIQQNLLLSVCSFAQAGAVAALEGSQDCVDAMVREFDQRRKIVLSALTRIPGVTCPTIPRGAFYVFVKHQVTGMDSMAIAEALLEKGAVALVPGSSFGFRGEGYLRLSYAASTEDCREGMARISRVMEELMDSAKKSATSL